MLNPKTLKLSKTTFTNGREEFKGNKLYESETNDCFVVALCHVCDVNYDESHSYVNENFKRKNNKGVTLTPVKLQTFIQNEQKLLNKDIELLGYNPIIWSENMGYKILSNPKYKNKKSGYTVKSFLETFNSGKYLILVNGHALAIVDGKLYDNIQYKNKGWYRDIEVAYKIK